MLKLCIFQDLNTTTLIAQVFEQYAFVHENLIVTSVDGKLVGEILLPGHVYMHGQMDNPKT